MVELARHGTGRPVLVLHGSGGGWDQGVDWARRRLGPGTDVLAVSRCGYLGSSRPGGPDHPRAVRAARRPARRRSAWPGWTWWRCRRRPPPALRFAGEHPGRVRSLLLESPVLPDPRPRARCRRSALVRLLARAQPLVWALTSSPLLVGLAAGTRWRGLSPEERAELTAVNETLLPLAPRARGLVLDAEQARELLRGDVPLEDVAAPTLVLNAAGAVLAPHADAEAAAARLPRGRLVEVATGGHVLVGNVDRLRGLVAGFLADPDGTVAGA